VMTTRPGRVMAEHRVNMPYPRTEGYRTSGLYNDYCRNVSRSLARAMGEEEA